MRSGTSCRSRTRSSSSSRVWNGPAAIGRRSARRSSSPRTSAMGGIYCTRRWFSSRNNECARRSDRKIICGKRSVRDLAPNVSELAGPIIAARLVTLAGGVEELARAPAGTVQLLGAERALFRHLRTGSRPPKHGVLFQHPWVHGAPPWQRGAIARAFAAKISLAARADAYTKREIAPELLKNLEVAIQEIRRRKADKPTRPKRPTASKNRAHGRRTRR